MKTFEILSHTADVRLKLEASTREGLFSVAIMGMNAVMKKKEENGRKNTIEKNLCLSSPDTTSLLVDFMSAVLTFSHEERAVFTEFNYIELDATYLTVKITGYKVGAFMVDVKAVTYHEAEVKKNKKGNWETVIIFDV